MLTALGILLALGVVGVGCWQVFRVRLPVLRAGIAVSVAVTIAGLASVLGGR